MANRRILGLRWQLFQNAELYRQTRATGDAEKCRKRRDVALKVRFLRDEKKQAPCGLAFLFFKGVAFNYDLDLFFGLFVLSVMYFDEKSQRFWLLVRCFRQIVH